MKLRIGLSGIGNRALPKNPANSNWLGWVELMSRSSEMELMCAQDISDDSIKRIIDRKYLKPEQTFRNLKEMLDRVACDALLICNPAEHHADSIRCAIDKKLHFLVEKPLVTDVDQGKILAHKAEQKGLVGAVIQNWRSKDCGRIIKTSLRDGMLGKIGHIFFRYVRNRENPKYPPYILKEQYPLLYAMGIHHLDLFRYILDDEYATVSGYSFKPPWSMYESDTGVNLSFKTRKGVIVVYSGTISSMNGSMPQESLIIEGENGSLANESDWLEPPLWFHQKGKKERISLTEQINDCSVAGQYNRSDEFILADFARAVRDNGKPLCGTRDGLRSVIAVEAGRKACETRREIALDIF